MTDRQLTTMLYVQQRQCHLRRGAKKECQGGESITSHFEKKGRYYVQEQLDDAVINHHEYVGWDIDLLDMIVIHSCPCNLLLSTTIDFIIAWNFHQYICWLPNREIYITGTAPCSTGTGYSTSTVRLPSWYCPTFFCRSIMFHFSVSLRYVRVLLTRCFSCFAELE